MDLNGEWAPLEEPILLVVRPAWALSCGCKSLRKESILIKDLLVERQVIDRDVNCAVCAHAIELELNAQELSGVNSAQWIASLEYGPRYRDRLHGG